MIEVWNVCFGLVVSTGRRNTRLVRSDGNVLTTLSSSASGIFAICCDLTRPTITRLARTFRPTRTRRRGERYMPSVAFCLSHFLADSIMCMYVFDFRQAQGPTSLTIGLTTKRKLAARSPWTPSAAACLRVQNRKAAHSAHRLHQGVSPGGGGGGGGCGGSCTRRLIAAITAGSGCRTGGMISSGGQPPPSAL